MGLKEPIDVRQTVREWLCQRNADRRDKLLACGAFIVAELRMQVLKETQFSCSAGIAHNKVGWGYCLSVLSLMYTDNNFFPSKWIVTWWVAYMLYVLQMLAKLASGMNKPAQQTVVPFASVKSLLDPLPIRKM